MHSATVIVAQWLIVIPILLWLYTLWASKPAQRWSLLFITLIGGIATVILAKIGASLVHDPRPFVSDGVTPYFKSASDNGFPSDHTLLATFLSLAIMSSKRWLGATLLGLAAMIGYARVLANVHHGIDILGALNYDAYDQPGPTSPMVTVFVDQPAPNQPGNQTNNQIIANAVGSVDAGDNDVPYNSSAQRIFEGTIIEPLAKVLGINTPVDAQVNDWIRVSIYLVFILAFIGLLWFTIIALR